MTKKHYWGPEVEASVKTYLESQSVLEKNLIFKKILENALNELVNGVYLYVEKKYGKINPKYASYIKEEAYLDLLSKLNSYTDYSKKSYSYYQTIVKNYVLGSKIKYDEKNKSHVSYDEVSYLLEKKEESEKDKEFEVLRVALIKEVNNEIKNFSEKERKIALTFIYMLENWHKINFDTKNQFVRQLKSYSFNKDILVDKVLKKLKKAYKKVKNNE